MLTTQRKWILVAGALVFLGFHLFYESPAGSEINFSERQKGVCWVGSRSRVETDHLEALRACGVTWISQTPFGWQRDTSDPQIRFETESSKPWWGESFEGIASTAQSARQLDIQTVLKPHLWIRDSWPGEIQMKNEEDWKKWFTAYEKFILAYAHLADSAGISMLCIGTELEKTVHRPEWNSLIKKIRENYRGKIIYAANFNEFEKIPFWDQLDFIGIQGYFPLTKSKSPEIIELVKGWQKPLSQIERVQKKFNKPVIFTEIGYKSTNDAAIEPWTWPTQEDLEKISLETQANCYEAFFKTVWKKDWLAGVYFWKWYPHQSTRRIDSDFTPQRKPAEKIMAKWFNEN
jgi:hypothetical protein